MPSHLPAIIAMLASPLLVPLLAPPALVHWQLAPAHLVEGAFRPVRGDWPLAAKGQLSFVGEGELSALVRRGKDPILTAGTVKADKLPRKAITVEAWVAVDQAQAWGGMFGALEDNGNDERGWLLGYRNRSFCFAVSTAKTKRLTYLTNPGTFLPSRWYHVVGTYDGKVQRLFVDGMLAASARTQAGAIYYADQHTVAVGAYKDTNEEYRLVGALHEVALFERALSLRTIKQRHDAKRGRLPAPEQSTFSGIPRAADDLAKLQPKINTAIDNGVAWLLGEQHRDGSWGYRIDAYRNGATSLALYTLLEAGVSHNHPAVDAALDFLGGQDPVKVYSMGCQLMALAELNNPEHLKWAERIARRLALVESEKWPGSWAYPGGAADLSNAQFAALGLWAAHRMGIKTPDDVWRRMFRHTIRHHQQRPFEVPAPHRPSGGTRAGPYRVAGFAYYPRSQSYPVSGSMTTAGICVLALADHVKPTLDAPLAAAVRRSRDLALGWLAYRFDPTSNPGNPSWDNTVYYYLYGVERVGALLGIDEIGEHEWYPEGARWLVDRQLPVGAWDSANKTGRTDQTCFAVLFLTRATGPTTGRSAKSTGRRTWVAKGKRASLQASGTSLFTIWIDPPEQGGVTVQRVRYFADDKPIAVAERAAEGAYQDPTFPVQHRFNEPGKHRFSCDIEVEHAKGDGVIGTEETLRPPVLKVTARIDPGEWMRGNVALMGPNLLRRVQVTAKASTSWSGYPPGKAVDGLESSAWFTNGKDKAPWLRLEFSRTLRTSKLILTPGDSRLAVRGHHDRVAAIEVRINRDKEPITATQENTDPLAPLIVQFDNPRTIKLLEIRITRRTPALKGKGGGTVGFAEIVLR